MMIAAAVFTVRSPTRIFLRYGLGRIWDTAIGLGVGMAVNMLVFPYNNRRQIDETVSGLDKDSPGRQYARS